MAYETILTDVGEGVGFITINRPEKRNALNKQVTEELRRALTGFEEDARVKLVVFTGAGEKAFVAGADIADLRQRTMLDALSAGMQELYDRIEAFEKPTIAAVNGYALGGGCELAMACDIRVATENARFGLPETTLSILPGAGGTQRLARLIGKGRATEMILTGRMIDAGEAHSIGLVSQVVPRAELRESVIKTARTIISKGPLATRLAKLVIQAGFETDQRTGQIIERLAQAILFESEDKLEGTAAFLEKRDPNFKGR
jgi:enoyl-CoA hydratase/carnithine racemase